MNTKKFSIFNFQFSNKKTQSGAVLLITTLVIATIGTMALAIGRIAISELHITTSYADSVVAYQAAEAGIERGLLEFRFNRNIEKDVGISDIGDNIKASLKISYKKPQGQALIGTLNKDQSIELDISQNSSVTINWTGERTGATGWVEWRLSGERDSKWGIIPGIDTNNPVPTLSGQETISINQVSNPKTLTIKFLSKENRTIDYQLSSPEALDSGTTRIESTGVFRRSQRKLIAEIDRKSGQLIGIFDYTLYAGEGNIQ